MQSFADALPLIDEFFPVLLEGNRQRLIQHGNGCVPAIAERHADGELAATGKVDLSRNGDVAVFGAIKLPVHFEIVVKILPSVAGSDEAAGGASKAAVAPYGKMCAVLPGGQYQP